MSLTALHPTLGFSSGKVPKRHQASVVLAVAAAEASTGLENADTADQLRTYLRSLLKLIGEASATGVSVAVAASVLKVSQPSVRDWVHRGILEATADVSPLQVTPSSLGEALAAIAEIRASDSQTRPAGAVLQLVQDRRTRRQLVSRLEELSRGDVVELSSNDIVLAGLSNRETSDTMERVLGALDADLLVGPVLTFEEQRSLAISTAVAGRLVADPTKVIAQARVNLSRMRKGATHEHRWLDVWESMLGLGPSVVAKLLMSRDPFARDLRQSSPFAGVLTEAERAEAIRGLRR